VGLVLGDPSGISLKFWGTGGNSAFQLHAGGGGFIAPGWLAISGSLLYHISLSRQTPIQGYLGPGVYVGVSSRTNGVGVIGLQMPFGLELIFSEVPLDLFMEIPPIFYMTTEGNMGFGLGMGLGLRFILK